jgi:hypothetical protein
VRTAPDASLRARARADVEATAAIRDAVQDGWARHLVMRIKQADREWSEEESAPEPGPSDPPAPRPPMLVPLPDSGGVPAVVAQPGVAGDDARSEDDQTPSKCSLTAS